MNLEARLHDADQPERIARRVTLIAIVVATALVAVAMIAS